MILNVGYKSISKVTAMVVSPNDTIVTSSSITKKQMISMQRFPEKRN